MADPAPVSAPAAAPSTPSPGGGTPTPGGGSSPLAGSAPPPGSPPTGGSAPGAAALPFRQKWKDTVDGKEVEFEADEAELRAAYRKNKGADMRFEQAAQMRKEAEGIKRAQAQLQQQLKQDPRSVIKLLKENGVEDPLDFIANALQGELAEEEKLQDPNVRARVEAENKLKTYEQKQKEQELEQQTQQFHQEVQEETTAIVDVFDKALALTDLPTDEDTLFFMAQYESQQRRMGLTITPEKLAEVVKERVMDRGMKVLSSAVTSGRVTGEKLLALNPALTQAFNKALIDAWKKRQGKATEPPARPQSTGTRPAVPDPAQRLSEKEAWEKLEKEKGTRLLRTI